MDKGLDPPTMRWGASIQPSGMAARRVGTADHLARELTGSLEHYRCRGWARVIATQGRRVMGSVHRTCLANGAVASMVIVQTFSPWGLWLLQTMLPARRAITSPSTV